MPLRAAIFSLLLAVLALLGAAPLAYAQPAPEPTPEAAPPSQGGIQLTEEGLTGQVKVHVGTYINGINSVDVKGGSFVADFWVWFRWQDDIEGFDPSATFELIDGEVISKEGEERRVLPDGSHYVAVRTVGQFFHVFDVRHYPLDDHRLVLQLEDAAYDRSELLYVADTENSDVNPYAEISGWELGRLDPNVIDWEYATNYGRTDLERGFKAHYSRYRAPIQLDRVGGGMYLKLFWGSHLAVLLALSAMLIKVTDLDARFGLGVGSLFAAMANAYIIAASLPEVDQFALGDIVNLLAAIFIFLSLIVSVFSLRLTYQEREEDSQKLDFRAMLTLLACWLVGNILALTW